MTERHARNPKPDPKTPNPTKIVGEEAADARLTLILRTAKYRGPELRG